MNLFKTTFTATLAGLLLIGSPAQAEHLPERHHIEESVSLSAPADKVWAIVGNFDDLGKWHPAIKSSFMHTPITRVLDLGDGKRLMEELEHKDDAAMTLSYRIVAMSTVETIEVGGKKVEKKVLPVNTYSSTLSVAADGSGSKVTWSGDFYPAWLAHTPAPAGMGDDDAVNTIKAVYRGGLDNLANVLGVAAAPAAEPAAAEPAAAEPAAAAPAAGEKVYASHVQCSGTECKADSYLIKGMRAFSQCQVCHGIDGNGSTIAPSLTVKLRELDHATFIDRVSNGYQGQIGVMPPWKDNPNIMKNIENLYAYLKARSDDVIPAGNLQKF